jgi:hypothetical protein
MLRPRNDYPLLVCGCRRIHLLTQPDQHGADHDAQAEDDTPALMHGLRLATPLGLQGIVQPAIRNIPRVQFGLTGYVTHALLLQAKSFNIHPVHKPVPGTGPVVDKQFGTRGVWVEWKHDPLLVVLKNDE